MAMRERRCGHTQNAADFFFLFSYFFFFFVVAKTDKKKIKDYFILEKQLKTKIK